MAKERLSCPQPQALPSCTRRTRASVPLRYHIPATPTSPDLSDSVAVTVWTLLDLSDSAALIPGITHCP